MGSVEKTIAAIVTLGIILLFGFMTYAVHSCDRNLDEIEKTQRLCIEKASNDVQLMICRQKRE